MAEGIEVVVESVSGLSIGNPPAAEAPSKKLLQCHSRRSHRQLLMMKTWTQRTRARQNPNLKNARQAKP
ncbi:hypothetical protein C4D60_Mb02t17510 [Musa balbisiana]|uniref:Uncharacterized protein n=1 Tax=Musa balbisiana TaxID=52838 RepID=A0A4S8IBE1_MUSBA|nr:hypothetical protein C4D60_Mb02t17510 [Musa balbisiana]